MALGGLAAMALANIQPESSTPMNEDGVQTYQLDKPDFHEAITGKVVYAVPSAVGKAKDDAEDEDDTAPTKKATAAKKAPATTKAAPAKKPKADEEDEEVRKC